MNEHHERVAAQVDDPLRFVGRIAERVLVGLHRRAHTGSAGLEISTHPGSLGLQDGAANYGLAQPRGARQLKREPGKGPKYGRDANIDRLVDGSS